MESCGFVPELVCWNSFEEQIQFEDANVQLLFGCEQIREQSSGLMSIFWTSDPAASCDQIMAGDHAMEGEQLAASFIQIDAPDRFEAYSDECSLWNAAPDESNADEAGAAGRSKKKARLSSAVQRAAKSTRLKKKKKGGEAGEDEESSNGGLNVQSSSSCSSEDDEFINVSPNGSAAATALNITGKARAERGAATDPQSLYARKRRERINERLRILQNLVPNGTKVDISTMLEEAVQYVKFLQLQIKLLSSDELWKYAPLAYNGMNIGFDLMIPATRL